MDLVADAVAGTRKVRPELGGGGLQESVVIGVLEARLEHVVIDIRDRELVADALETEGLELKERQRAGGVLGQGVVDPDRDLVSRGQLALDEVLAEDRLGDGSHQRASSAIGEMS